jgi:hypothetical protein
MGILQSLSLLPFLLQAPVRIDLLVIGNPEVAMEAYRLKVPRIALAHETPVRGLPPAIRQFTGSSRGQFQKWVQPRLIVSNARADGDGSNWCVVANAPAPARQCLSLSTNMILGGGKLAAWLASAALREGIEPRAFVEDPSRVAALLKAMVEKGRIALWPYADVSATDAWFEAANLLATRGVVFGEENFEASKPVNRGEMYMALLNAKLPFTAGRGEGRKAATWRDLFEALREAGKEPAAELGRTDSPPLLRHELATHLWAALKDSPQSLPPNRP